MNSRQLAQKWPYPKHNVFVRGLRRAASGWFKTKGFPTHSRMSYCLDKWENWPKNIILPKVAEYIRDHKECCEKHGKPFPLHKYVHHGLSSQAMAFNLVGPLLARNDYQPLLDVLREQGVGVASQVTSAVFEYEDRTVFNEDSGQPTSIDIVLRDAGKAPIIFVESKLVEQEFGGCSVFSSGDCDGRNPLPQKENCYLHFIGRTYWS